MSKSLMSLGEMLDEYICLKEWKMMLDQERVCMEQEKNQVQIFSGQSGNWFLIRGCISPVHL